MPAEHRVAHRTADQGELVAGLGGSGAPSVVDDRRDPVQLRGHRRAAPRPSGAAAGRRRTRQETLVGRARRRPPRAARRARASAARVVAVLRPLSLLPALVAVAATSWRRSALPRPRPPAATVRPRSTAGPRPAARRPTGRADGPARGRRSTRLDAVVLPEKGPIQITGTVTNRSRRRPGTAINVYAFIVDAADHDPRRARRGAARRTPPRSSATGSPPPAPSTHIDGSRPGETRAVLASRCRASAIVASAPGVYWFGVHALGDPSTPATTASPTAGPALPARWCRRGPEAGRHRPGHPAPPPGPATPATAASPTSAQWAATLSAAARCAAGRLRRRRRARPGHLAGRPGRPGRRARGSSPATRPGRSTTPCRPATRRGGESPTGEPAPPSRRAGEADERGPGPPRSRADERRDRAAAPPGSTGCRTPSPATRSWRCRTATSTSPAAAEHDPELYDARTPAQRHRPWSRWGFPTAPAVASPSGYLDPAALPAIDARDRRSWSPTGCSPTARRPVARRRRPPPGPHLVGRPAQGGPGPGDPLSAVAAAPADPHRGRGPAARPGPAAAGRRAARRTGTPTAPGFFAASTSTGCDLADVGDGDLAPGAAGARPTTSTTPPQDRARARRRELRRGRGPRPTPARPSRTC